MCQEQFFVKNKPFSDTVSKGEATDVVNLAFDWAFKLSHLRVWQAE